MTNLHRGDGTSEQLKLICRSSRIATRRGRGPRRKAGPVRNWSLVPTCYVRPDRKNLVRGIEGIYEKLRKSGESDQNLDLGYDRRQWCDQGKLSIIKQRL